VDRCCLLLCCFFAGCLYLFPLFSFLGGWYLSGFSDPRSFVVSSLVGLFFWSFFLLGDDRWRNDLHLLFLFRSIKLITSAKHGWLSFLFYCFSSFSLWDSGIYICVIL